MSRFLGALVAAIFVVCLDAGPARADIECVESWCYTEPGPKGGVQPICCDPGEICIDHKCWGSPPRCELDEHCGGDRKCTDGGVCTCATDADCGNGQRCGENKQCALLCEGDSDCAEGFFCNGGTKCEPRPCESNSDCGEGICLLLDDSRKLCATRGEPISDLGFSCATGPLGSTAAPLLLIPLTVLVAALRGRRRKKV